MYVWGLRIFRPWRRWLRRTLPHIAGPRVLEVSFGTGYLLTQYADRVEAHGLELSAGMVRVAQQALKPQHLHVRIVIGSVDALPYRNAVFDTVVNTMAFSGYADGRRALREMHRVLRPGGRIVMVDMNYPERRSWIGTRLVEFWKSTGDVIRDVPALLRETGFDATDEEIGGWGSVHLYVGKKVG